MLSSSSINKQQGSVLLWGIVILVGITTLGVVGARMAVFDTRIAYNQSQVMLTYQTAESELEEKANFANIVKAAKESGEITLDLEEHKTSTGVVKSQTTIKIGEKEQCPIVSSANSFDSEKKCVLFSVKSNSWIPNTGVRNTHEIGMIVRTP